MLSGMKMKDSVHEKAIRLVEGGIVDIDKIRIQPQYQHGYQQISGPIHQKSSQRTEKNFRQMPQCVCQRLLDKTAEDQSSDTKTDDKEEEEELNFFQKIWAFFMKIFVFLGLS